MGFSSLLGVTTVTDRDGLWSAGLDMFMETGFITVLFLLTILIISNIIRRKIPFMRGSMMPTAVIGGILAIIVKELLYIPVRVGVTGTYLTVFNQIFNVNIMNMLVYHLLPIGFIAIGLRDSNREKEGVGGSIDQAKYKKVSPFRSGAVIVSTYMMQAVVGILITMLFALVISDLFPGSGIILPLGFGQGPGQAQNAGSIFEDAGFKSGLDFGIAVAGLGFIWASLGGVFMLNRIAKKRGIKLTNKVDKSPTAGALPSTMVERSDEVPLTESIDKFTIQICLIGIAYLLTFLVCLFFDWLLRVMFQGGKTGDDIARVLWGFNFCFGIVIAMLMKLVLKKLQKGKVMHRNYLNNYMLNRISGFAFDFMIIASLAALSVADLGILWIPLIVMTSAGGISTIFFLRFLCKRIYKGYSDESFVSMYGTLTGTLSNGMILLRELDPNYKTPAAMDQVVGASTGLIFGIPILFLISMAADGNKYYIVLGIVAVYLILMLYFCLGKFTWLQKIFKRKKVAAGAMIGADADSGQVNFSADSGQIVSGGGMGAGEVPQEDEGEAAAAATSESSSGGNGTEN